MDVCAEYDSVVVITSHNLVINVQEIFLVPNSFIRSHGWAKKYLPKVGSPNENHGTLHYTYEYSFLVILAVMGAAGTMHRCMHNVSRVHNTETKNPPYYILEKYATGKLASPSRPS